jgi:hypothetical protein
MTKPFSPATFVTAALALVDDAGIMDADSEDMFMELATRYRAPNGTDAGLASEFEDAGGGIDLQAAESIAADVIAEGWSAAFVGHVGYCSHFDLRLGTSVWPLPVTPHCGELEAYAASNFALAADEPQPGDIYLLWSRRKMLFVRAGIVLGDVRPYSYPSGRSGYECLTIDGDTTPDALLHGPYTAIVQRVLSPDAGDRLIRWPLLERTACTQPSLLELPYRTAA